MPKTLDHNKAHRKTKLFVTSNAEKPRLEAGFASFLLEVVVCNLCCGQANLVPGHSPWVCPHLSPWLAAATSEWGSPEMFSPAVMGAEHSGTGCAAETAAFLWQLQELASNHLFELLCSQPALCQTQE